MHIFLINRSSARTWIFLVYIAPTDRCNCMSIANVNIRIRIRRNACFVCDSQRFINVATKLSLCLVYLLDVYCIRNVLNTVHECNWSLNFLQTPHIMLVHSNNKHSTECVANFTINALKRTCSLERLPAKRSMDRRRCRTELNFHTHWQRATSTNARRLLSNVLRLINKYPIVWIQSECINNEIRNQESARWMELRWRPS